MSDSRELIKVFIELPDDEAVSTESFWAEQVGAELFELRNTPFRAYDLNFLDVVRAVPEASDQMPKILSVVTPSGHKTLRVFFSETITEAHQLELLEQLSGFHANYERANNRLIAIDVLPDGDYQAVCDQLWAWEQEGILQYETGMTV
jgi:hypothetical protein